MAVRDRQSARPVPGPSTIRITVGIHGDEGAAVEKKDNARGPDLTVAQVATFHEFGVPPFAVQRFAGDGSASVYEHPGVPQRSFVRAWYDENQAFIRETLQSQMKLVIAGKLTAEKAGARIALAFEGAMKKRISRGIPPPNAPSTIEQKGSSKPLIRYGQLRAAVRGKVEIE